MRKPKSKELIWVGSSLEDLQTFPSKVRQVMGFALYLAQTGEKHPNAKPMKGFHGAGVLEVVDSFERNTYRTVYTVKLGDEVYVLHAFQKKATKKIATPKHDLDLIRQRYEQARKIHGQCVKRR